MKKMIEIMIGIFIVIFFAYIPYDTTLKKEEKKMLYTMPAENFIHEGTWLTWPHQYTYGIEYQNEIEDIWIQITLALHNDEMVHIISYNKKEKQRITKLLQENGVNMDKVDFVIAKSDDVWIRDTGPIFLFDKSDKLLIANFAFDGWGNKVSYKKDDDIPISVGKQKNITRIDISDLVLEGGAIEMDGKGTLMACLSSVVSKNRNQNFSIKEIEDYLTQYLSVTNFIWLNGVVDEDITDAHIDGIARFVDDHRLLSVSKNDFSNLYENINMNDYYTLKNAKNAEGTPYEIVELPLTKKNVKGLDYKGSYMNYYVGNKSVLVPIYEDANDRVALKTIASLYPERTIVPIVINRLYKYGGMIHCITQQQPIQK